jgi:hypothetical protein
MRIRNLVASLLIACLPVAAFPGIAPAADANSGRQPVYKPGKTVRNNVITIKRRARIHLPVGPTQVYCDYPYYYSRGHYPTHIGGYAYYPHYYRNVC